MYTSALLATIGLSTLAYAQKLDKPPLEDSLDYLQQGLMDNLPSVHSTNTPWNGWIPTDCQQMTKDANLNPDDVTTFNVTYDDVSLTPTLHTHQW